jgi:hypothetical protein
MEEAEAEPDNQEGASLVVCISPRVTPGVSKTSLKLRGTVVQALAPCASVWGGGRAQDTKQCDRGCFCSMQCS